jgi:8-oxo-dGTP pyrophosphatase MutT (NUDIX family)
MLGLLFKITIASFLMDMFNPSAEYPGAGIILVRGSPPTEVLLVRNLFTGSWSFTKGTHEPFDATYRDNAVREVWEEAGLIEGEDYTVYDGPCLFKKRPYWFGTVYSNRPPLLNIAEHMDVRWVPIHAEISTPNKDLEKWINKGRPLRCNGILNLTEV